MGRKMFAGKQVEEKVESKENIPEELNQFHLLPWVHYLVYSSKQDMDITT